MLLHGSACAWDATGSSAAGVLLLGPPGCGKSDFSLRLLGLGFTLVADDQVELSEENGQMQAPSTLAGMIEIRGLGIVSGLPHGPAPLTLVVDCLPREAVPRLPVPAFWRAGALAVPRMGLHATDASAPAKVIMALDVLAGRRGLVAGAFAA
ncbi:Hpr(Ser) kinase/phosphatase [Humitalea rosea]|uniref:Hpr(Ser) kinase/phosphatase n=1 Tax=Humitalea rosea TaxID=990373 RepID=A0A2W7IK79_9PROT|nr:aldolase [Humitalea rosea]PZW45637.1 Hpr(Ser) kinase/phosphatase [Humitalea rosea]